jgi:hypothetical protein
LTGADIGRLCEGAQQALVEAHWEIGRRIVEVEQKGHTRAPHGDGLLDHLSSDLSAQYRTTGFSASNLERMRTFYRTHPKSSAPRILAWTQYVGKKSNQGGGYLLIKPILTALRLAFTKIEWRQ